MSDCGCTGHPASRGTPAGEGGRDTLGGMRESLGVGRESSENLQSLGDISDPQRV